MLTHLCSVTVPSSCPERKAQGHTGETWSAVMQDQGRASPRPEAEEAPSNVAAEMWS